MQFDPERDSLSARDADPHNWYDEMVALRGIQTRLNTEIDKFMSIDPSTGRRYSNRWDNAVRAVQRAINKLADELGLPAPFNPDKKIGPDPFNQRKAIIREASYLLAYADRRLRSLGGGISSGGNQNEPAILVSGASARQQRAAATSAARAAAVSAARKVTPATITKLPQGVKGPGFTPFKGTDFNIRDNVYAAARSGRLRTVNDIKRAASNIENATFRAKVIAKAQRLALAAIRAGR
jgi:hypothetical protein